MLLQEPNQTPYDFCFVLFGIPVRVHPMHWVVGAILGARYDLSEPLPYMVISAAVIFISILVHEMGHSLAMRYYGEHSRISLYWMGGLAIPEGSWKPVARTTTQQVVISFAGPAAGFLLAGVIIAVGMAFGFVQWFGHPLFPFLPTEAIESPYVFALVYFMLYVNIFWGVINLIPVYPLDGGQISRAIFLHLSPWHGLEQSLWVSVVSGGLAAGFGIAVLRLFFMGIMFGVLAFQSFQTIQNIRNGGFGSGRW